jgi:hypothetical protein
VNIFESFVELNLIVLEELWNHIIVYPNTSCEIAQNEDEVHACNGHFPNVHYFHKVAEIVANQVDNTIDNPELENDCFVFFDFLASCYPCASE